MNYKSFFPKDELAPFIKCYWSLEAPRDNKPVRQRIAPDGCMEMIFHYGDPYLQYPEEGPVIQQPRCFVFGQITRLLEIAPTGETGIFAIRFTPGGFAPFISIPVTNLENRAAPLDELFGDPAASLEKQMMEASTNEMRISLIEKFFLNRLMSPELADRIVASCVDFLLQGKGKIPVHELSRSLKISQRQLERRFTNAIGLSPKQLAKVIRLQSVLKLLASREFSSLTSLAYEADYCDQAHFIKEFKEFTGLSPKKFYSGSLKMSALFSMTG